MARITRRLFLLSSAALPLGCATRRSGVAQSGASAPAVRQPATGQSWHYAKHDLYTHALIDDQIDTVAAVGQTVDIDSRTEAGQSATAAKATWGTSWLRKYVPHHDKPPAGPLPDEVQDPWGKVLVDPHWGQVQVYESPIPLWPAQLTPGWHTYINTKYKTPNHEVDGLPWSQTMTAQEWETVNVPAGRFRALRFINKIGFRSTDFSHTAAQRQEKIWFAPEVGRWVARESSGSFYIEDSSVDTPYDEPGYRWELLEWS